MKESYYLNLLEASRMKIETKKTRTPLEMAVETRKYDVITHPVMQRLIHNKWLQFGRLSTILDLFFYVIFNLMWTAMSVITPAEGKMLYRPLNENIWRVVLLSFIGILIVYQVVGQARGKLVKCSALFDNIYIKVRRCMLARTWILLWWCSSSYFLLRRSWVPFPLGNSEIFLSKKEEHHHNNNIYISNKHEQQIISESIDCSDYIQFKWSPYNGANMHIFLYENKCIKIDDAIGSMKRTQKIWWK